MKINAISIDDEEINQLILTEIAKTVGIDLMGFLDPLIAAEYIKSFPVDLVYVDYMMPGMDGIEMIRHIRSYHPDVPIIMITTLGEDREIKLKAIEAGATEFLSKPIDTAEFTARTRNLIALRKAQLLLMDRALLLEEKVKEATRDIALREFETLSVMGRAAEYKDPETANHIVRVAHVSRLVARAMGLDDKQQELIYHAAPLHDVGKLGIPDSILLKPGGLTEEEFQKIKTHTGIGFNILKDSMSEFLLAGAQVALSHHERYSGSGYPLSLRGEEIPLFGRIVAIADSYDAMVTRRPYKEPWPVEKVTAIIREERGKQFDPGLVDVFLGIIDDIVKLYEQFRDEESEGKLQ